MKRQELKELRDYIMTLNEAETIAQILFYSKIKEECSFFTFFRFKTKKRIAIMLDELNYHMLHLRRTRQARLAERLKEIYNICD